MSTKRWDESPQTYRVERRGRGGNYDRYWIDCPFCKAVVKTYGKELIEGVKCNGCNGILLSTGVAHSYKRRDIDALPRIFIELEPNHLSALARGEEICFVNLLGSGHQIHIKESLK